MAKKEPAILSERETNKNESVGAKNEHRASRDTRMYVGASLPGIKSNTVISGALPKVLDEPFVRELVIPPNEFAQFLKKKSMAESREAFCYRKSVEYADKLYSKED